MVFSQSTFIMISHRQILMRLIRAICEMQIMIVVPCLNKFQSCLHLQAETVELICARPYLFIYFLALSCYSLCFILTECIIIIIVIINYYYCIIIMNSTFLLLIKSYYAFNFSIIMRLPNHFEKESNDY